MTLPVSASRSVHFPASRRVSGAGPSAKQREQAAVGSVAWMSELREAPAPTMKALVNDRYGPPSVLAVRDVDSAPKFGEVAGARRQAHHRLHAERFRFTRATLRPHPRHGREPIVWGDHTLPRSHGKLRGRWRSNFQLARGARARVLVSERGEGHRHGVVRRLQGLARRNGWSGPKPTDRSVFPGRTVPASTSRRTRIDVDTQRKARLDGAKSWTRQPTPTTNSVDSGGLARDSSCAHPD